MAKSIATNSIYNFILKVFRLIVPVLVGPYIQRLFDKELYGKHITVEFLKKMRDEQKFDSLDELSAQIVSDCESARAWFDMK